MPKIPPVAARRDGGTARWASFAALFSAALPFVLYLRTMAPTVYGVDSAELATGAYLLGIVHPPGCPTYLLLGHLFTWLPFGDVGYRVNLMSACAVAASLFFFFRILRRLHCGATLALATALFVGVSYYVWASAVAAEVYSLQGCFAALLILLALRVRDGAAQSDILFFGLIFGVGLGVHQSLVLLAPGLTLLALGGRSPARPSLRSCALALLLCALGACVYLYLPLRYAADLPLNPARDSWRVDLTKWQGFRWMVTSRGFSHLFFAVPIDRLPHQVWAYAYQVWSNFMGMGALAALAGLAVGLRRNPSVHGPLLLMLLGHLAFYLPYGAGDKQVMFLPTYLLWGIWIGVAAQAFADRGDERRGAESSRIAVVAALFGMAILTVAVNFRLLDVSDDWTARRRGVRLLQALEPSAVLFGSFSDLRLVEYLQFVEGKRADIQTVDLLFTDARQARRRILERVSTGAPVYVRSCRDWRPPAWSCEQVGDLGIAQLRRAQKKEGRR